jgi:hypothetical protein
MAIFVADRFLLNMSPGFCTAMRGEVRAEWDEVKQHDVLFLLTIRPPLAGELEAWAAAGQGEPNPAEKYGLVYVRGCEVTEVCPPLLTPRPSHELLLRIRVA